MVREAPRRGYRGPVLAVALPGDEVLTIDTVNWDEQLSKLDDMIWSRYVFGRSGWPFSWHNHLMWWIARRWIEPRDVRKR